MLYLSRLLLSICGIANIQHCALVVASPSGSEPTAQVQNSVDEKYFEQKVRPIFEAKCLNCHGPKQQKSSYRIDVREIAIKGGDHGESAIVPGRSQESRLFEYVSSEETDFRMPPKESNLARLNQFEIEVIRQWIDRGAIWPDSANVTIADPLDW